MNGVPLYTSPWLVSPPTPRERFYKKNKKKEKYEERNCKVEFFSASLAKANEICQNRIIKQELQTEKDKDKENKNLLSH